jgi:hypothetical protein
MSNIFDTPNLRDVKYLLHQLPGANRVMSEHEKYAWLSLIGSGLVWLFFEMRMLDGWQLADVSARHMLWTYVTVVVLMIVLHAVSAGIVAAQGRGDVQKDERDHAIEARADRIEGYVVLAAINVLIIQALAQTAYTGRSLARIELTSVPALVFALISVLFLGHIGKQVATIWSYRA